MRIRKSEVTNTELKRTIVNLQLQFVDNITAMKNKEQSHTNKIENSWKNIIDLVSDHISGIESDLYGTANACIVKYRELKDEETLLVRLGAKIELMRTAEKILQDWMSNTNEKNIEFIVFCEELFDAQKYEELDAIKERYLQLSNMFRERRESFKVKGMVLTTDKYKSQYIDIYDPLTFKNLIITIKEDKIRSRDEIILALEHKLKKITHGGIE